MPGFLRGWLKLKDEIKMGNGEWRGDSVLFLLPLFALRMVYFTVNFVLLERHAL
jgi:hypothetical protein